MQDEFYRGMITFPPAFKATLINPGEKMRDNIKFKKITRENGSPGKKKKKKKLLASLRQRCRRRRGVLKTVIIGGW